jgi:uncharacterized protein (DUF885 family)
MLARDPETACAYGIAKSYGVPEDELSDLSDAHALGSRNLYLAIEGEAHRRLPAARGEDGIVIAALIRWLDDRARDIEFSIDRYPVSPYVNSPDQLAIDYFTEFRPLRDAADAERWMACLAGLPSKMRGLADAIDRRAKEGVVLPRGIYEQTLQGLREVADAAPGETPFFEAFSRKLEAAGLDGETRSSLEKKAAEAIGAYASPAWKVLVAALEREAGKVPAEAGASRLPRGKEYYAACLARYTTTNLDAVAVHQLGLKELSRVQAEIRDGFRAMGYPKDASFAELYARLGRDGGAETGAALFGSVDADIKAMESRLDELVLARPRIGVEAVAGELGAYYQPPSNDGSRPGRYFVAAKDYRYRYDVATTVFHETVPGHHLQIARALEADLPGFLRTADFLGYSEGWALYAERLAFEMGFYEGDPAGNLGRLRMEALRAARLVADTGVNSLGWSFGKASEFLAENTGLGRSAIDADVTRYFIDPGQATAYYVGYREMLDLREKARSALGNKFDIRRFHEAVLSHGALPLDLFEQVVDAYIAEEEKRP